MVDAVNKLNRAYTRDFSKNMRALKPKKSQYPRGGYGQAVRKWQRAYAFTMKLKIQVNKLNNRIILKGKKNRSKRS